MGRAFLFEFLSNLACILAIYNHVVNPRTGERRIISPGNSQPQFILKVLMPLKSAYWLAHKAYFVKEAE